jgi:peptidoglycan/xylan/chitin deacetylase (PgdA/CDA1 family)
VVEHYEEAALQKDMVVTARFLDQVVRYVRSKGYDIVTLDEALRRVRDGHSRRFVSFTFDDGYADAYTLVLPVFRRHQAPFTVYVTTGILERTADFWWQGLEELILCNDEVSIPGDPQVYACRTMAEKVNLFDFICSKYHADMRGFRPILDELLYNVNPTELKNTLTLDQLRALAADPFVEIGSHSVTHRPLSQLSFTEARHEIVESRRVLEHLLGREVRHFCYPYGTSHMCGEREFDLTRACGYTTGTINWGGNMLPTHRDHPHALPRLDVIGRLQWLSVIGLQLSGIPSLLERLRLALLWQNYFY